MDFSDDRPIDLPQDDEFHRSGFAARLASGLILGQSAASLVLGLEAPWGWGKTSVINMARGVLNGHNAIVIDFQPWLVGARDALVQSFLIQLAASIQLKDRAKEGKEAAEQLLKYSSLFTVLKLIPGAEPWATVAQKVVKGVGNAAKDVSQLKQLDVEGQRRRVIEALSKIDKPIVVIVDDLDRLPPSEVFEVIRFVKAVADFDRVSYLLSYDHAYVKTALEAVGVINGEKFLEKIVQVRLHLPPIAPVDARAFFERRIASFNYLDQSAIFPQVAENLSDVYLPHLRRLLTSPRAMVRLVNRLAVSHRMTAAEVTFGDLMGLEALAILAPGIYEGVRANPERFLGAEELSLTEHVEKETASRRAQEYRDELLRREALTHHVARDITGLLDKLFPVSSEYSKVSMQEARRNGNIVEISRLRVALNLGLLPDDLPLDTVRRFVSDPDSRQAIVDELPDDLGILERFIELVGDLVEGEDIADPPSFATSLGSILNRSAAESDVAHYRLTELDRQVVACLELAIKSASDNGKGSYFRALLDSPRSAWLAMRAVELMVRREERHLALLKSDEEAEIVESWQISVAQQLHAGLLLSTPYAGPALFSWRRISGSTFSAEMAKFTEADENFIDVVRVLGVSVISSSHGAVARWDDELVAELGDIDTVRARAKKLLATSDHLDNNAKAALLALAHKKSFAVKTLKATRDW